MWHISKLVLIHGIPKKIREQKLLLVKEFTDKILSKSLKLWHFI